MQDPRIERLPCTHKGTYADDCICERVRQHKCYIVATCDRDLRRRIRKVSGCSGCMSVSLPSKHARCLIPPHNQCCAADSWRAHHVPSFAQVHHRASARGHNGRRPQELSTPAIFNLDCHFIITFDSWRPTSNCWPWHTPLTRPHDTHALAMLPCQISINFWFSGTDILPFPLTGLSLPSISDKIGSVASRMRPLLQQEQQSA